MTWDFISCFFKTFFWCCAISTVHTSMCGNRLRGSSEQGRRSGKSWVEFTKHPRASHKETSSVSQEVQTPSNRAVMASCLNGVSAEFSLCLLTVAVGKVATFPFWCRCISRVAIWAPLQDALAVSGVQEHWCQPPTSLPSWPLRPFLPWMIVPSTNEAPTKSDQTILYRLRVKFTAFLLKGEFVEENLFKSLLNSI